MPRFRYLRPGSLDEALDLLAELGDDAKVLAGGQSLIPAISLRLAQLGALIDIGGLDDLAYMTLADGRVRVGALARHRELERPSSDLALAAPLLAETAPLIGHAAIRNRGTMVGSLAHGDPAAEWPAVAVALDAELRVRSRRGDRVVSARDFYVGPLSTVLEPDELVVEVSWPAAPGGTAASTRELVYRHGDYAIVGVVGQALLDDTAAVKDVRLALFGVGPVPIRADAAERILLERDVQGIRDAAQLAAEAADPASDASASAGYRRAMVEVYVRRTLESLLGR